MSRGKWAYAAEWVVMLAAAGKGFHDGFASLAAPPLSARAGSLLTSAMISLGLALVIALVISVQTNVSRCRGGSRW